MIAALYMLVNAAAQYALPPAQSRILFADVGCRAGFVPGGMAAVVVSRPWSFHSPLR